MFGGEGVTNYRRMVRILLSTIEIGAFMSEVNYKMAISILIILIGYMAKRFKIVSYKDGEALARVIFNFILPAIIINAFTGITIDGSLMLLSFIGIAFGVLMLVLGNFFFKKEDRRMKGMLIMPLVGLNIGLFAYPLVEVIFGQEAIKYYGMIDIGNAFSIFIICYLVAGFYADDGSGFEIKAVALQISRSIPLIAYVLTLVLCLLKISYPRPVLDLASIFSDASQSLSLLTLGIFLTFKFEKEYVNKMCKVLIVKYAVGLGLGIAFFLILPFNDMFNRSIMISLTLPSSLSILPFSVEHRYDTKFVGSIATMTIVISIILMWIMAIV